MALPVMLRLLLALCMTLLALVDHVHAWYGTVTFYHHIKLEGPDFPWGITQTNRCYNLSCFDKRASSIEWDGVKTTGGIDDSGRSYMAFYLEPNCKGQAFWWAIDSDQPSNLEVDGLSDKISSFMVWDTSKNVENGYDTPCPWGTT